jgi:uncharacterized protein YcbK (DUF882 family)
MRVTSTWTRRRLLQAGGTLAGVCAAGTLVLPRHAAADAGPLTAGAATAGPAADKRISLYNLHTDESRELVFYRGGDYVPEAMAALQVLLRDFRNGEQHVIDPHLMDTLHEVAKNLGVDPVFSVISGYRSPQTNERLRERSGGVARHSLHLEGRAIDVRLTGVDCASLATRARAMASGGVGYYRRSDFVHLDTGACRTWNG